MGMAMTLREYLESTGIPYEELDHPYEVTTSRIAEQVHIPGERMAKAVLISGESGYTIAVLPGSCKAHMSELSHLLNEHLGLATEDEIRGRFGDCDPGALPPVGKAYGMPVCVDEALFAQPDVYFEAGDHKTLVRMRGDDFRRLMSDAAHGRFSRPM